MKNGLLIPPVPPCGFRAAEGESRYSLCLRPSSWHSVWSLIIHGRRRKNVFPLRQADPGWTRPGRGPIRAACPGAAGHQPLPALCRLDVTVVRQVRPGVIAPVPGIMRLFWAFSSSNPPESPSQEESSLANMPDTLEARCRSDGPPAGPRSIDPLPGSRSFLTVSAVA